VNRRRFLTTAVAAAGTALSPLAARTVLATPRTDDLVVTPITDRLFVISGGGGNVTVFDSPEGVLLVDGGSPERAADILRLVKERTGADHVHTLFNTHWHWEHTGANRLLGPGGTRIIAHENTRLWLGAEVNCKWRKRVFAPLPLEARPNETFYTNGALYFGGERIEYGYLLQAHTDGDIYVFFRNANVLVAGDVVSVGAYPIPDYSTGGWIGGTENATKTLLELADESTRIVPGIGPVQGLDHLRAEHEMLSTLRLRLSKLLAQGMSAQDMIDAEPTREYDAVWGDPQLFIRNVWYGLSLRARELGVSIV